MAGVMTPPLSPRNASYTIAARASIRRRARSPDPKRSPGATSPTQAGDRSAVPSLLERVEEHALDVHARARARRRRRRPARAAGRLVAHRRHRRSRVAGGGSHTAPTRFIAPDDDNPDDETVMAVPLPQPIAPGGSVDHRGRTGRRTCRGPFARTGAIGNFFFIAQWFPKLGVLQDDGWNCHQFHAGTEFFSDYGVYDVSLTVPAGWPLGATGVRARAPRQRRRHDDAPLLPGRRPRLRVDDEPRLPRADRALRASARCRRSRCGCCCSRSTPAQADRHFDATRTTLKLLRRVVRRLSVRPHHDRRSRVSRAAPAAWSIRRCSPPARAGSRRRA